jgi:tRNA (cytidine/uridine-2'-O-)-methyltransferase
MININNLNIVLYKPEIAMNVGNIMRTCTCCGITLHLIEPLGFPMGSAGIFPSSKEKRSMLDYNCQWYKYSSWENFLSIIPNNYLLVGITPHTNLIFNKINPKKNHILVFGRESSGFEDEIHNGLDVVGLIPMVLGERSFNICNSVSLTISHWLSLY